MLLVIVSGRVDQRSARPALFSKITYAVSVFSLRQSGILSFVSDFALAERKIGNI